MRAAVYRGESVVSVDEIGTPEIGAGEKPTIMVFNKMDRLNDNGPLNRLQAHHPLGVAISAMTGEGISVLLSEIGTQLRPKREFLELRVPHEQAAVIARLHKVGQVITRRFSGKTARFKARIPPRHHDEFAPYIVRDV